MIPADLERELIVEALHGLVARVKAEALRFRRSEEDYPVTLRRALEHLSREFGSTRPDSGYGTTHSRSKLETYLKRLLESGKWDHKRIGRRRTAANDGHTFTFFLPGDDHFVDLPITRKAYLKILFSLERRHMAIPLETRQAERPVAVGRHSFEEELRSTYEHLIKRTRGATYVRIPEIRRQMTLSKEIFDAGVLRMRDKGQIILSKHGYAASLSQQDLDGCVEVAPGDYYYYLEFRDS